MFEISRLGPSQATVSVSETEASENLVPLEVLEDPKPEPPFELGELKLELVPFIGNEETSTGGQELVRRAEALGANYGEKMASSLLASEKTIPEDWKKFCLVFPRKVYRDKTGERRVLSLVWEKTSWRLELRWLDRGWGHYTRFVKVIDI